MKILNEKGKLFGIINIVDLLIIVVLVLGAGVVYKYFNSITQLNGVDKSYNIVLEIQKVDEDVCKAMKKDKTVFDRVENVPVGTLLDFEYYPSEEYSISEMDASIKKVKVPDAYDALLTINITTDEDIYVGKRLSIATKDFTASGYVIETDKLK